MCSYLTFGFDCSLGMRSNFYAHKSVLYIIEGHLAFVEGVKEPNFNLPNEILLLVTVVGMEWVKEYQGSILLRRVGSSDRK